MSLTKTLASLTALIMISTPAFARQTKSIYVTYQSLHTYYSCSGAEDEVRSLLSQLGALKIHTSCSGGLQSGFVDVSAKFTVADSTDLNASWETVRLHTNGSCGFDKAALKDILPAFSTDNVHLGDNCGIDDNQGLEGTLSVWK